MTMNCDSSKEQVPLSISGQGNQTVVLICNVGSDLDSKNKISIMPTTAIPIMKEGNNTGGIKKMKQDKVMFQLQKEIDKQKKLLAKAEANQKKEAEKLAKEAQRKQKMEEKSKIREKEEQEKKERKEKREADRKRKLAENAEKNEAKRRKELEKEEKERLEKEKKQRLSEKFVGFFDRKAKEKALVSSTAPPTLPRQPLNNEMSNKLDLEMKDQNYQSDYLAHCKLRSASLSSHGNDEIAVICVKPRFKLLQFSENHRPPYWGSWRKKSKGIKARAPFNKDKELMDYDIDSDDEWEEEEPGESLSDSETESVGNNDEQEEDDEFSDGFFVPHGYLSDDEGNDSDGEMTEDNRQRKQLAKVKAWEAEFNKKHDRLVPIYLGIVKPSNQLKDGQADILMKYSAVLLNCTTLPINTCTVPTAFVSDANGKQDQVSSLGSVRQPVPESAMPDLIRHVHKSNMGVKRLIDTFREYWAQKNNDSDHPNDTEPPTPTLSSTNDSTVTTPQQHPSCISKRQLELKIASIASKDTHCGSGKIWTIHNDILRQYGFSIENEVTPLNIKRAESSSPDNSKKKTTPSQVPVGMKSIKHFFNSPSNSNSGSRGVVRRSLSLQTPPQKKRRIALEPVIILDDDQKESHKTVPCSKECSKSTELLPQGGIDWGKQLENRSKLIVPADIHV